MALGLGAGHYGVGVDRIWEQWDLVCVEPAGCSALDQLMRAGIWVFVLIGLITFYGAIRQWTTGLPRWAGVVVSAIGAAVITRLAISIVGSSGRVRTALIILGIGLVLAWIGRPSFLDRRPNDDVSEDASPTSATH